MTPALKRALARLMLHAAATGDQALLAALGRAAKGDRAALARLERALRGGARAKGFAGGPGLRLKGDPDQPRGQPENDGQFAEVRKTSPGRGRKRSPRGRGGADPVPPGAAAAPPPSPASRAADRAAAEQFAAAATLSAKARREQLDAATNKVEGARGPDAKAAAHAELATLRAEHERAVAADRTRLVERLAAGRPPTAAEHNLGNKGHPYTKRARAAAAGAVAFAEAVVPRRLRLRFDAAPKRTGASARTTAEGVTVIEAPARCEGAGTFLHEIGHAVEDQTPGLEAACRAFLDERCGDEEPTPLFQRDGGRAEPPAARGRKDSFDRLFDESEVEAYYVGKVYDSGTEVVSMGLQKLYNDPVRFCETDPDFAAFLFAALRGDHERRR